MDKKIENLIISLPLWNNNIKIKKIDGGITNQNFLVTDNNIKYFVRVGEDIPEHLVFRSNEIQASIAASKLNVCPEILFHNKSIQVFKFIEGKTLNSEDIKNNIETVTSLIKNVHKNLPNYLLGQSVIFWVFHVIKNYINFLEKNQSSYKKILPDLLKKSNTLENSSSPFEIVFSHNDLLAANFIKDEKQIWLIDWEYAGFNTPLFDLGGLASNNDFNENQEKILLENYYEEKLSDEKLFKYKCIKCASLLRETMWSMVSEIQSNINFDYKSYTNENLTKFSSVFEEIQ
tara:strand:+ start:175 stop:1041 length:867 start_codon:yes stop_codon:yes gene_type:complete